MNYILGVDVGGTFTDLIALDEAGEAIVVKVPSTPADPSIGVMNALEKAASNYGKSLTEYMADVIRICHGTTISTNAILTGSGAKVGLLTTKGFRDLLELRVGHRENQYDYSVPMPKPLTRRALIREIEERVKWNGEVATPLNEKDVRKQVRFLKEQGVEALAICFLWSFINPVNELRAEEICKEEFPEAYLTVSSKFLPEIREYKRLSSTVINAYVGPLLSKYISHLDKSLKDTGYVKELLITQSSGGVMSSKIAAEQAARTVLSGPACGPAAGVYYADLYGFKNLITIDMGGTSLDVCLIKNKKAWTTDEQEVAGVYHLRLPSVDVHTIGAGGGSIAWTDPQGLLHVGPQSAAADPGPVCYGRSGEEPTVTDADLLLGYLNPDYFLGGEIKLNKVLASKAIKQRVAKHLGMNVQEAARSIVAIVNASMSHAISVVSVQRGEDPREYVLVAAGSAGPMHAVALAKMLGIKQILVPKLAAVFCALGSIISDLRHDYVRTIATRTEGADFARIEALFREMEAEGNETLAREGIPEEKRDFIRIMDMRYIGQFHEVDVEVPRKILNELKMSSVVEHFHQRHEALYAYRDVAATEIINLRVVALGRILKPSLKEILYGGKDVSKYQKAKRDVFFEERGDFTTTPIYDGDRMLSGNLVEGPAVVELKTTTIVVPPDCSLKVLEYGDYLIKLA